MPNDEVPPDSGRPAETAPDPTPPAPSAPDPTIAALAEMRQAMQAQERSIGMLANGLNAVIAGRQQENNPAPVSLTDEQIEELMAQGKGATALRILARQEAERMGDTVKRDYVDPIADRVNNVGIPAMVGISEEIARPRMKYYDRYKDEIQTALNNMDPAVRVVPQNIMLAHDIAAARHLPELEKEWFEQGVRSARENAATTPTPRFAGPKGEEVESAAQLYQQGYLDQNGVRMIQAAGGEEAFCEKYLSGRYSWPEYSALLKEQGGGGTA